MSNINVTGFGEFFDMLEDMEISEQLERKALKMGGEILRNNIVKNSPSRNGNLRKSIKGKITKTNNGDTCYKVTIGVFYGMHQEWGTSQQKSHIGFFERSIKEAEITAIKEVKNIILKGVGM
ncbi:HK97 gp10 family phage protein [Clostridium gasigenes]|uniref:HK97-gp10 family putative phage morphogenesis protein n=1 Tax=Clostridium gasigenes TaxID=94869 RepID=UPI001C0C2D97|nr:HK97-gp10 family putative phage morphogenesis protein [Clostridium gasigenes]MBU3135064.1 HK97 gp10 family phage protein [Clostridium gasigenes]